MGAMRKGLSGLGASLLCLSGCWWSSGPQMKPPPPPPEYILPPADDARFSQPPSFPDKTLNEGLQKKDSGGDLGGLGGAGGPGGMRGPSNRFGGPGAMGGGPGGGGY
jgi:hypothetical protein